MYAEKNAQEAYVESLQRMTVEQLIAEVMRVQIAAAELIKQEVATEREAIREEFFLCLGSDLENGVKSLNEKAYEDFKSGYPALSKFCDWINLRGEEGVTH